jgi:hypothetical protein
MENKDLKLAILNLTGELQEEFSAYFAGRGIQVIDPINNKEKFAWTHILTKDIHDFSFLARSYQTIENDVKIISLTKVDDPQNFFIANGRLVMDELWMKGPLGELIFDKFFQEYAGISMGGNYPKFQEKGSFNIINPFSTGDSLDRLVLSAFSENFAALSVKTYFDHLLMYLAGLRNKGKAGVPIEITYGTFDDIFGLQFHFFAEGLMLDDITGSLQGSITKKAEEYLLNVTVQSADFFDFTFLAQVKKVVITALWTKEERIKVENRGFMFSHLAKGAALPCFPYEGPTAQMLDSTPLEDLTDKIELPAHVVEVSGEDLSENLAERISSAMELKQIKQLLSGEVEETDKIVVGSQGQLDDIMNLVKGTVDKEQESIRLKGGKLDVDDFTMKISMGIQENVKGSMNLKSLGSKLPDSVKSGLLDFAKRLGKPAEDLTDEDLGIFSKTQVPEIIMNKTVVGEIMPTQIRDDLKGRMAEALKGEFMEESLDTVFASIQTPEDLLRVKSLVKDTLKTSLNKNFQLNHKDKVTEVEKDFLVKSLSVTFSEDEEKFREIVDEQKTPDIPLVVASPSENEKKLSAQAQAISAENEGLRKKMKTLMIEVKVLKNSLSQISSIQAQANQVAQEAIKTPKESLDPDSQLRKKFQEQISQGHLLNEFDQKKLFELMEREARVLELAKQKEFEAKKLAIEAGQKEVLYKQELGKANHQINARDMIVAQTKEKLQKVTDKKDSEIADLELKINSLNLALSSSPAQSQAIQIKNLERQNQNAMRMVEMYKQKITSMASLMQASKTDDGSKEEVRRLQMLNNQFNNQLNAIKKEVEKYKDKMAHDMKQLASYRTDNSKLQYELKRLQQEKKIVPPGPKQTYSEADLKKAQLQIQTLENQVKDTTTKLNETETRLTEALKAAAKQVNADESKKVLHLETIVKKLSADVMEAKNQAAELKKETNKARQEKTALQNQIDKQKKDADKSSKESAKKKDPPNAGGKAA